MKILIVEDDPLLNEMWTDVLSDAGYWPVSVDSAEAARKLLLVSAFDIIIVDLFLGEDSGLSVATIASYASPDCRIVMITGSYLFPRGELFEMNPSIVSVLRKPVSIHELIAVVEYEIGRPKVSAAQHEPLRENRIA